MHDRLATLLVHAGARHVDGAVVSPVYPSANYLQQPGQPVRYMRLSNSPQHEALATKLAAIEGAEQALVCSSGMAAISTALLSVLSAGDHLLVQRNVYGGTTTLLAELERLGIEVTRFDPCIAGDWSVHVRPATRAVYVESLSNPLLDVPDLQGVVDLARSHGLVSVIDNTFLSPAGYRPVPFGFDLVVHSATKYLNGHSDVVAGVVAGAAPRIEAIRQLQNHLGGSLDSHACFLLDRGLKTLHLRVPRQAESAAVLARWFGEQEGVTRVRYPGLPGDPSYDRAARWFTSTGGMLSFELATDAMAERFLSHVGIGLHAASLGGLETLLVRPAHASHVGLSADARSALGITERLVRVSVGVEDVADLRADFQRALGAAAG